MATRTRPTKTTDGTRAGFGHGDVLILPAPIPADATKTARRVLAEGEATGHAHRLLEGSDVEAYEDAAGTLWLRVGPGGARITHEEHGVRTIEPGEYRVSKQAEYDHFLEETRDVRD